jgi:hypothetical protein
MKKLWHRLICKFWHRYNIVVCQLPPTWCDRDYLLLYASFQILEDFVEKEDTHFNDNVYNLYSSYGLEEARLRDKEWKELREIYSWWQKRKNNDDYDNYDEDTAMLHRLISVRHLLWT